ncbi:MAG: ATP-dependent helicase [Eubacteriales bacterium]
MDNNNNYDLKDRFINIKRVLFNKLYSFLNPAQRDAVFTVNGPLLVLAGAGSGKTTVLTERIAFIIKYGDAYFSELVPDGLTIENILELEEAQSYDNTDIKRILSLYTVNPCPPWAILSITFTNKAANEMKLRLTQTVGELPNGNSSDEIWAGTFHSICMRFLRKYSETAGLAPGFTIYDTDDSKRVIGYVLKALNIDEKTLAVKSALTAISRAKDQLMSPDEFEIDVGDEYMKKKIAAVYREYQKRLIEANVLDFDDIIMRTVLLLQKNPDTLDYFSRRFKYICVDEYQDTNNAQFTLIKLLSQRHNNLMVVGDDDQSIYKFRGARIENILNFDRELENTKTIKLEQNYRSTQNILHSANAVISNNIGRRGKQLFTTNCEGEKVCLKRLENQTEEARYIINKIAEHSIREKRRFSDFAVLYRINAQSNSLEQVFAKSGIPYRIIGGLRFYERKEIKDILAYLCVINNRGDNLRLRRIINEPKRKIGDTTVNAVEQLANYEGESMFEIMEHAEKYPAISKFAPKLHDFTILINGLHEISQTERLPVLIEKTIELTGYQRMLLAAGEEEADRLENIRELMTNAVEYEKNNENPTLESFLEEVALVADIDNYDNDSDAVVLMTVHNAKGLEFPIIFIPGFEENIFPGMQSTLYPDDLEEERRLAYVAITRAKERLYCLHVRERILYGRTQYNQPSRFVKEIPDDYLDSDQLKKQQAAAEAKAAAKLEEDSQDESSKSPAKRERARKNIISKEFFKKADSASSNIRPNGIVAFETGDMVTHTTFGRGEILSATLMGADILYEIAFDDNGTKKLMATYAKLKKV